MGGNAGGGGGGITDPNSPHAADDRVVVRSPADMKWGHTGPIEPEWPTELGAEITVHGLKYRAIRARKVTAQVLNTSSRVEFTSKTPALRSYPTGVFRYGVLHWVTGQNAGIDTEVRQYNNEVLPHIELFDAMPYPIQRGDEFTVSYGCAKTRAACKQFDNINNHRGFPDMPTEEKVLATPDILGSGEIKKDTGGGKKGGGGGGKK